MKKLAFFAVALATPAAAHPAGAAGHLPHTAYLVAVIAVGVAMAIYNARKA